MGLRVEDEDVSVPILRETERVGQARFLGRTAIARRLERPGSDNRRDRPATRVDAAQDVIAAVGDDQIPGSIELYPLRIPENGARRRSAIPLVARRPRAGNRRRRTCLGIDPKNPMHLPIGEDDVALRIERQTRRGNPKDV